MPQTAEFVQQIMPWLLMALPWFLLLVGCSFLYKAFNAIFFGRAHYWKGFLPISIISPFFTHLPAAKKSPVKVTHQWWIHVVLGPIFLFLALGFLATGADLAGWEGTGSVNRILTVGQESTIGKDGTLKPVEAPIIFNKQSGYRFPMLARLNKFLGKLLSTKVLEDQEDK